jgi:transposase InsO family protein
VKLKRNKCTFLTTTVEYLGHEITGGEIRPSSHKLTAVADFKTPENVHEVRQFLGLASYFRKFIKGFAAIARPLTHLTKKTTEWCWGAEQTAAIETLKRVLTSDPVLAIYDPSREIQIHTDASKVGLGGVLLQCQVNGEWRAVAYASRQTSEAEAKYHSFELEALAVVFAIQKFKVYVSGLKFRVVTDCSALRLAWSRRDLSPRIARWWLDLQEYDFEVEHRPGTSMSHVDALSRNPVTEVTVNHIEEKAFIDALQDGDEEIQTILSNLELELKANNKNGLAKDYKFVNGLLCRVVAGGSRPVLPKSARWHILNTYHDKSGHLGTAKCLEAIQAKYWFPKMRKTVEKYVASCVGCQFTKKPTGKQPGLLHPIPRDTVPFHTLHVDHLGQFCKSGGKTYIFAIIDGFTKFVWLEAVASANARGVITALNRFSQVFGYPVRIVSDRGTAFTCREFKDYCVELGIKHVLNAVASPRANGQVERLNRTILSSLTAHLGEEQKGWDTYLAKVQLGINSTVSQGTGKSPLELLCGLRPRLSGDITGAQHTSALDQLRKDAAENIEQNAAAMKLRFDKGRRATQPLSVGTLVMVERKILRPGLTSGKLVPRYAGPYKINAVLPNDRYEVSSAARGKRAYKSVVARDRMKLWKARQDSCSSEDDLQQNAIAPLG